MYPSKITLISLVVFSSSLLIQKINFASRRTAYFYCYNTELKHFKGSCLSRYKDNMTLFQPLETKLWKNCSTQRFVYYPFLYFWSLMHHAKLKQNSRFTPWKKGQSRHHAMHHFHVITPINLRTTLWRKGQHVITPTTVGASLIFGLFIIRKKFFRIQWELTHTDGLIKMDIFKTQSHSCYSAGKWWNVGQIWNFYIPDKIGSWFWDFWWMLNIPSRTGWSTEWSNIVKTN